MKQLEGRLPMITLYTEPAFPVNGATSWYPGMTLRDYFAAQFLQGSGLAMYNDPDYNGGKFTNAWIAKNAYAIADAMMEARKQGDQNGTDI